MRPRTEVDSTLPHRRHLYTSCSLRCAKNAAVLTTIHPSGGRGGANGRRYATSASSAAILASLGSSSSRWAAALMDRIWRSDRLLPTRHNTGRRARKSTGTNALVGEKANRYILARRGRNSTAQRRSASKGYTLNRLHGVVPSAPKRKRQPPHHRGTRSSRIAVRLLAKCSRGSVIRPLGTFPNDGRLAVSPRFCTRPSASAAVHASAGTRQGRALTDNVGRV
jgi:hypothetical protein